ncbi:MAG: CoA-binding protein [Anaerolineae bacterium]
MRNPTDEEIKEILKSAKNIAVVGLSDKPGRDSHRVAAYLKRQGYKVFPVNPTVKETLGERSYPRLEDIPQPIDVVDIFRAPEHVLPIVESAIAMGAKVVWMQLGVVNEEAAKKARDAGLTVVMDRCMMQEHKRLLAKVGR